MPTDNRFFIEIGRKCFSVLAQYVIPKRTYIHYITSRNFRFVQIDNVHRISPYKSTSEIHPYHTTVNFVSGFFLSVGRYVIPVCAFPKHGGGRR